MFANISERVTGALITIIYAAVVLATSHFLRCCVICTNDIHAHIIDVESASSSFYVSSENYQEKSEDTFHDFFFKHNNNTEEKHGTINLYCCLAFLPSPSLLRSN